MKREDARPVCWKTTTISLLSRLGGLKFESFFSGNLFARSANESSSRAPSQDFSLSDFSAEDESTDSKNLPMFSKK